VKIKLKKKDYTGYHHYHSGLESYNFAINLVDRNSPLNWINFLTFNVDKEPEIVAYNLLHTYIPENKSRKDKLVRATPDQIMKYLES